MSNNSETVNIFLPEGKSKELIEGANVHESYIILQNNTLHTQNRKLLEQVKVLETRLEELENIEDRADVRNNNLKGLLKNFHEMDKWRKEVEKNLKEIIKNSEMEVEFFRWRATRHLRIFESIVLCFLAICFETLELIPFINILSFAMIVISFQEATLGNIPLLIYEKEENRVKELTNEITKAVKAQDYIHEFLDQQ
jgi:hypothetical protein